MSATARPKKVGLMVGREYSFPPAFIERVGEMGKPHGITAEMVQLGGTKMDRASGVRGHRRSDLSRGRVLPRVAEAGRAPGHLRHQQPFLVDG